MKRLLATALAAAFINVAHAQDVEIYKPHWITRTESLEAIDRRCKESIHAGPGLKYCLKVYRKQKTLGGFWAVQDTCKIDKGMLLNKKHAGDFGDVANLYAAQQRCFGEFARLQHGVLRRWLGQEAGLARWRSEQARKAGELELVQN